MHETDRQIERGLDLHRAGNIQAAAEIYQEVLERDSNQPDALYLLGCLAYQADQNSVSVELLNKAILARPGKAEYFYALGNALAKLDNDELAEHNLREATRLGSRPEFHTSLGLFLNRKQRLGEAVAEFEAARRMAADDGEVHFYLGKALHESGKLEESIASFEEALKLRSWHVRTLAALRRVLASAHRDDEANARLEQAIEPVWKDHDGLCDVADALQEAEDLAGAIAVYERALGLSGDSPRAWYACGCAQILREDFATAMNCFDKALRLRPEWLEARHNLARSLYEMGQVGEAFEEFKVCAGRGEESARLARAMMAVIAPGAPQAGNEEVLLTRRVWAKDLKTDTLPARSASVQITAGDRLRIGYISSFFPSDNWMKPVWGLINQHDRRDFDIYLFSDTSRSAIRHGYNMHEADHFFDTSRLSNRELAELIQERGIELLIDLNGYSEMKRLPMFMLRPAPVIVGWFNMYATTGMPCFDALIGDGEVIPREEEGFYTESIHRVSQSYLAFSVDYPVPPVAGLPCEGGAPFTFGCLGSQYKITNEVVEAWSRILIASPGSRLLLKNKRLKVDAARAFVTELFLRFGVARERIVFEGPEEHYEFLKVYESVDVALDTFPYNGGTTTTEAIWQGVPVITFVGDRWASRTSASILRAGGLGEFVAGDLDGYVALAVRLANSPEERPRLASLRSKLREQLLASSVCDTRRFAREMEGIYRHCLKSSARP